MRMPITKVFTSWISGRVSSGNLGLLKLIVRLEASPAVFRTGTRADHLGDNGSLRFDRSAKKNPSRFKGKMVVSFEDHQRENGFRDGDQLCRSLQRRCGRRNRTSHRGGMIWSPFRSDSTATFHQQSG